MIKQLIKFSFISILLLSFSSNSFAQDSDGFIAVVTDVVTSTFKDVGIKIKDGRKTMTITPENLAEYKDNLEDNQTINLEFTATDDLRSVFKKGQKIKGIKIGDPDSKNSLTLKSAVVKSIKIRRKTSQITLGYTEIEWN